MFVRFAVSLVGAGPVPAGALVGATEADEAARASLTPTAAFRLNSLLH